MAAPLSDEFDDAPGAEVVQFRPRNSLDTKMNYAKALAQSGLLPAAYRKNPANVLYAVEYGEMLGLAPMAAISGIHVIDGKPTASAALISALVRKAGHKLRVTGNDQKAVAELIRKDDPDFTFRSEWTIERARQAGLTGKNVWKSYPAAMLKARAVTEVARDACEESLSGVHYTPEELGAEVNEEGLPTTTVEQVRTEQHGDDLRDALDIDWDAAIEKCGTNRDALLKLYHRAPEGEVKNRILKLGKELKAKEEAAQAATEAEVVDAEVVEDEEPAAEPVQAELVDPNEANPARLWDALLDARDYDTVVALSKQITATGKFARADVSAWIAYQPILAGLLGVKVGEPLTLSEVAALAAQYVEDNKRSLNEGIAKAAAKVA